MEQALNTRFGQLVQCTGTLRDLDVMLLNQASLEQLLAVSMKPAREALSHHFLDTTRQSRPKPLINNQAAAGTGTAVIS